MANLITTSDQGDVTTWIYCTSASTSASFQYWYNPVTRTIDDIRAHEVDEVLEKLFMWEE
jgi:hypothetical protein